MDSSSHEQRAESKRQNPRRSDLIDEGSRVVRALKGQAALRRTIRARCLFDQNGYEYAPTA